MRHGWIRGGDFPEKEVRGVVAGLSLTDSWSEVSLSVLSDDSGSVKGEELWLPVGRDQLALDNACPLDFYTFFSGSRSFGTSQSQSGSRDLHICRSRRTASTPSHGNLI